MSPFPGWGEILKSTLGRFEFVLAISIVQIGVRLAGADVKSQDIALVIVRAIAATWLIYAGLEALGTIFRFTIMMLGGAYRSHWMTLVEFSTFLEPMQAAIAGCAMLALSRPVARFAAKPFEHDVFS